MKNLKLAGKIVENGYTYRSLAKEIGVSPQTIHFWVYGKITKKGIEILTETLHIPPDEVGAIFFN